MKKNKVQRPFKDLISDSQDQGLTCKWRVILRVEIGQIRS
jgi:hypothetical protein